MMITNEKLQQDLKQAQKFAQQLFLQQEEDRKEISRELHDEVAQILTSINFQLAILSKEASESAKVIRDRIAETQKLIEDSVEIIHHFARKLRPMILDDLGLVPAIKSYIKSFSKQTELPITLTYNSRLNGLNEFNKVVLFRVIQESLCNISKHAKATKVSISIRKTGLTIFLDVHDNGRSFKVKNNQAAFKTKRLGLLGMAERVRMAKGQLTITSSKAKGTLISVQVPYTRKSHESF
jgi:signal transduction histidine kinase